MFKQLITIIVDNYKKNIRSKRYAKIILLKSNKEIIVKKKTPLINIIDPFYFSCCKGYCNTCNVNVKNGMRNLSKRTEYECNNGTVRKMCQCAILQGTVELEL